jgi:hypothetical protein
MMRTALKYVVAIALVSGGTAHAGDKTFQPGSLIIPTDLSYQSYGMYQAYGLVYQLLAHGVHVNWVINPTKTWHKANCNTAGDLCTWDCGVTGSGPCTYPTASPDFSATVNVIWDDKGATARGSALGTHAYRGGPFVIDAADHDAAMAVIDGWNDKTQWAAKPYAKRTTFHVVSVHETTDVFTANVAREMVAAPSVAVFADGNEKIATSYLLAAGIPQSSGAEFPAAGCGTGTCGPGTANPDMLTEEQIMGDLGTCDAPNYDHKNGALWKPDGTPAFCQIMSMHWNVTDRETVKCAGGNCPATQGACTPGTPFTYNGHEVVAEVRAFLGYSTHFFAECQAVNAYENTVPNPEWPFLDDAGRNGHFLTTTGTPPSCGTCPTNYTCVNSPYCAGGSTGGKCCMASKNTWLDIPGYEVATQPTTSEVKTLRADIPYNQMDGIFVTTTGSEPAYNLSPASALNTTYQNNQQVTLLTGANGPNNQDLWMSGYLDGCSDIGVIFGPPGSPKSPSCQGKISYLGGHQYTANKLPLGGTNDDNEGTRLFLNALFEAQCTTAAVVPPGGATDTDGDGIDDGNDGDPNDPHKCGDFDMDGCDDCSSGHYDPQNDCAAAGDDSVTAETGDHGGCCEAGDAPVGPKALVAFVVGALLVRPRRRRRR